MNYTDYKAAEQAQERHEETRAIIFGFIFLGLLIVDLNVWFTPFELEVH